jgi:hypothetical protein
MSVERLTSASSHVVLAQAIDSWTEWNPQHTSIYTITRFQVRRSMKGDLPGTILVKQPGGRSGPYQQKVAGVRHWRSGEESVLFVHPARTGDGRFVVTGLMQGDFKIVRGKGDDAVVSNGIAGVEQFDPQSKKVNPYSGTRMRLSELESRVRRAAQK